MFFMERIYYIGGMRVKIIDLHCDTLYRLRETGARFHDREGYINARALQQGHYLAQCFAVYQPAEVVGEDGYRYFAEQCCLFEEIANGHPLSQAKTAADIRQNNGGGLISALLTVENADFLQGELRRLEAVEKAGVTILGLIHNKENCLGHPQTPTSYEARLPLKPFGKEVVECLNNTGIIADVSHLNVGGFRDVAALSKKPFIASHAGCRAVWDHPRNLYDDQIRQIALSGGVVGMVFYSRILNGTDTTSIEDILRHLHHLIRVGGEEVAALGSDFDGMDCKLFLKDAGGMPTLAEAITKAFGYPVAEKVCYKNALRVL